MADETKAELQTKLEHAQAELENEKKAHEDTKAKLEDALQKDARRIADSKAPKNRAFN